MTKILLIDDDANFRCTIALVLRKAGYEVIEASNGAEGLPLFQAHRPALVITDILMPEKEGIETVRALRDEAPTIPIIGVSGLSSRGSLYLEAVMGFGADVSLAKPFGNAELLDAITALLANPRPA